MTRGDVWLAAIGRKRRPVLVLTRTEVIDVRVLVTVAEITTVRRGLATEIDFDHAEAGVDRESVINSDGLHTVSQTTLTTRVGKVEEETMERVCAAISYGFGC